MLLEKLAEAVPLDPRKLCRCRESFFHAHQSKKEGTLEGIDRALLCGLKVPEGIWIHLFMNMHRTNRVFGRFVARTPFGSEVFARDGMTFCQVR